MRFKIGDKVKIREDLIERIINGIWYIEETEGENE